MNQTYRPHEFDPQVAELYTLPAALILQYIDWYSTYHTKWVPLSTSSLTELYPYMGRDQIGRGLSKLVHPGAKTPALVNRKPSSEGRCFLYTPVEETNYSAIVRHRFNAHLADKLGIEPAIIYYSIYHWIVHNWQQKADALFEHLDLEKFDYDELEMQRFAYKNTRRGAAHYTTVAKWLKHHKYMTKTVAYRGFVCLQKAGLLTRKLGRYGIAFWYLPEPELSKYQREMLNKSRLGESIPKTKRRFPKPNNHSQNQTTIPKTTQTFPVNGSVPGTNQSVIVASSFNSIARGTDACVKSQLVDDSTQVPAGSPLARARRESAGTALKVASASPSLSTPIEKLNYPNVPKVKKKLLRNSFGHPVKRMYIRRPRPDDPDFDEYIDNLTPEERTEYLSQFQKEE